MASDVAVSADSDDIGLFNFWGISMSPLRKRGPCSLLDAAKHNKREIQAEIGYSKKIDPSLIACNRRLAGAVDAAGVVALAAAAAHAAGVDVSKLKKDHCQALELLFGLPRNSGIDEAAYFAECLRWAGAALPGLVVLSADIHADEERPHLHILLSPFKEGVSVSRPMQSTKSKLELSKSFFDTVAGPAGLTRAHAKLHGRVKAAGVRVVVRALEALGAALLPTWKLTLKDIERNTLHYLHCLGIDPQSLLVDVKAGLYDLEEKPHGHMTLSATVDNLGQINQGHSCMTLPTTATKKQGIAGTQTTPAECTPAALVQGAGAGNRNGQAASTASTANLPADVERRKVAMAAQAAAMGKHCGAAPAPKAVAADLTPKANADRPRAVVTQAAHILRPPAALVRKADAATRRRVAHVAVADATNRHASRAPPPADRGDGITRERDADFDVAAWRDA